MTDHVSACRCIWCASDPDKVRECGAPHPYAGSACARPSGHTGGHGNSHRAWLAEALSEAPSVTQEGSGADRARFVSRPEPGKSTDLHGADLASANLAGANLTDARMPEGWSQQ